MNSNNKNTTSEKIDKDLWWRYVSRPIAVFIFKHFLLKTPITANQLTIIGTIISIIAAYMISLGGYKNAVIGCLIFQISLIIDCADGTVARYRKTTGLFGMYVEELSHKIVPTFLMFGLGINSFIYFKDIRIIYVLGLTVVSMYLSTMSRSAKTELLVWDMLSTRKIPTKFEMPKICQNGKEKNLFERITSFTIDLFNSPAQQQTLLLIVALFGYIHYAIFFFFIFYTVIAVFKVVIEYKSGFKIYGMER